MRFDLTVLGPNACIVLSLSIMLLGGFLMTRLTKLCKLPNVTGFIFAGILIGPWALQLIPTTAIGSMDFVTDVALSFIAFDVGRFFKFSALKRSGKGVFVITVFEALAAAAVITLTMIYIFHLPVGFSLLLGAIGSATAPASTIMTIRQYHAKGNFVDTILQVVALDDAVALIAFSLCAAIAQGMTTGGKLSAPVILLPVLYNLGSVLLGVGVGFALRFLISPKRTSDNRLILSVALLLAMTGFCTAFNVSPLLGCMAAGTVYINLTNDKALFKQLNGFTPPILILFFVLSGLRLNLPALLTAGVIGVGYFFVRILGKYLGAFLGAALTHAQPAVRNYLGLALIPQAGVSIGLAMLGQRLLPPDMGSLLSTIILSSAVLYELVGPAAAKASLILAGAIPKRKNAEPKEAHSPSKGVDPVKHLG